MLLVSLKVDPSYGFLFLFMVEADAWNLLLSVIRPLLIWVSPKFRLVSDISDKRFYNNLFIFHVFYSKKKKKKKVNLTVYEKQQKLATNMSNG